MTFQPYTYIVRHGDSDFYKIGLTSSLKDRIMALQTSNPVKLTPLFVIHQQRERITSVETKLHALLRNKRVQGEWFDLPELRKSARKEVLNWLVDVGLVVLSLEQVDSYTLIKTCEDQNAIREKQLEIDADLLLFLDTRLDDDRSGVSVKEVFTSLSHHQPNRVADSISKLVGSGRIGKRRPPGATPEFYLMVPPSKTRVIYSLPREYYHAQRIKNLL